MDILYKTVFEKITEEIQEEWITYNTFLDEMNICYLPDGAYKDGKKLNYEEINKLRTEWDKKRKRMKTQLEIGDKIKRYEIRGEISHTYEIISTTKTLAKTINGDSFYRNLEYNTTKPREDYIAEVKRKETTSLGKRYFLIE